MDEQKGKESGSERRLRHGRSTDRQAVQKTTNNIGKRSTRLQRQ